MQKKLVVVSLGGSLVNPGKINVSFLKRLKSFVKTSPFKFVFVCGGGFNARAYARAAKSLGILSVGQDEIGIKATLLNAELVRQIFSAPPVQQVPKKQVFKKVLVASGWKTGHSSDFDAVLWAVKFRQRVVFNLTNVDYVYDRNPLKFRNALPIKMLSWKEYGRLFSSKWVSGLNVPFDPVASALAERSCMRVFSINGSGLDRLKKAINGLPFVGTVIG